MNLSVVANQNIRRVDVCVAENVIERFGLKLSPQCLCSGEHLANACGIVSPEGSKPRGDRVLELRCICEIQNAPD
jgi:hypothetical protein